MGENFGRAQLSISPVLCGTDKEHEVSLHGGDGAGGSKMASHTLHRLLALWQENQEAWA